MSYLPVIALLLISFVSTAQTRTSSVALRVSGGLGISNKPGTVFGAPFALSGELATIINDRWRIAAEGGVLSFRDSKYPYDKIGLIFSSYSRYDHQYVGILVGHTLLAANESQRLFLSSGADYLLIVDPNIQTSSGFLSGKSFNYLYERYLNIPFQLDYSVLFSERKQTRLVLTGRWNFNPYHSFPMISIGVELPIYTRSSG
jgi:hypothetical protein